MLRTLVRLSAILSSACLLGGCATSGLHQTAGTTPAAQPLKLQAAPDSGDFVTPPSLADERVRCHTDTIDTLALGASRAEMAARCREMDVVLRECGRADDAVVQLLLEVKRESDALLRTGYNAGTCCLYGTLGGLLGAVFGGLIGQMIRPSTSASGFGFYENFGDPGGGLVGCPVGCALGAGSHMAIATSNRMKALSRQHRSRVNKLISIVNRTVATSP